MVALGCGVGIVPELVRKDSPLRGRIEPVDVRAPAARLPRVAVREEPHARRGARPAALWELAPATASL